MLQLMIMFLKVFLMTQKSFWIIFHHLCASLWNFSQPACDSLLFTCSCAKAAVLLPTDPSTPHPLPPVLLATCNPRNLCSHLLPSLPTEVPFLQFVSKNRTRSLHHRYYNYSFEHAKQHIDADLICPHKNRSSQCLGVLLGVAHWSQSTWRKWKLVENV